MYLFQTAPLKGIPSRVPTGGFKSPVVNNQNNQRVSLGRTPVNRKDGGIKLIDINEQPLGYAQAKKRKRLQGKYNVFSNITFLCYINCLLMIFLVFFFLETEDARKASEAAASQQPANSAATPGAAATTAGATPGTPTPVTPDYAAGLAPINPPTPAQSTSATVLTTANPGSASFFILQYYVFNCIMLIANILLFCVVPATPQTPIPAGETVIILVCLDVLFH